MLDVNGMVNIARKAGNASLKSCQLMRNAPLNKKLPTMNNTGAVKAATEDTASTNGKKKTDNSNRTATVKAASPLLAPNRFPFFDSMYGAAGVEPNSAPTSVATESLT